IQDRLDLQVVVSLRRGNAPSDIQGRRVDFGSEEVVQPGSRRTVQDLVSRVFIGPGGATEAVGVYKFANGGESKELMRINGGAAICRVARQSVGIDPSAAVQARQILIDCLVVNDFGSREDTLHAESAHISERGANWRSKLPVVAVIVINTGGFWRASCGKREHPRERVRRLLGQCIVVSDALVAKMGEGRIGIFTHESSQILFVKPVDADKQYPLHLPRTIVVQQGGRGHQDAGSQNNAKQSAHLRYL